ncbi:MAG: M20/M25/M40 family metallo-hydrolase [Acidisphaera sp.]|nr:M20/M25/M40 family metallo-hydrolase [Acidisphaera sp.]
MTDDATLQAVLGRIDDGLDAARERWFAFLRIPSVSAQPVHAADCRAAAAWARDALAGLGFDAAVRETAGQPCVVGHHPGPGGTARHLLFYGHYDVQPAEPLDLWTAPPFEPVISQGPRGARVTARGAVDDKGQVMTWLEAFRAWHAETGGLPVRATVLLEGEEEIGSPSLDAFLAANREELRAETAVIADTNMWDADTPAITTRLRGMAYVQIDLRGPGRDLHSGLFGGAVLNPINALTKILGDLHDAEGRVQIPGFYDGVRALSAEQQREWASLGFDEPGFLAAISLSQPAGEAGRPALERLWARPTADLNGIWGGYTGVGSKTVIAAEAHAKLSFRLVAAQDPTRIIDGLKQFVEARRPRDAQITYQVFASSPGIEVPTDSPFVTAARAALADEFGRPAVLIGSGGSIPVVASFRSVLGMDSLLVGFGLDDDQVHSPNEKFDVRCFHNGMRAYARLIGKLAA